MPDARTNATPADMAALLGSCESLAICGHVNPDGDCLGSELALAAALRAVGKQVTVLLAKDAPVEEGLHFLPGFGDLVPASRYEGTPDAFVYVDVSVRERVGDAAAVADRAPQRFVIDHHAGTEQLADRYYIDPSAASCSLLIWEVIAELGVAPTADIALCAYTGLMTDTGRFQFQNTDARAFQAAGEMVAAGAQPALAAREFFQNRSFASLQLEQRMVQRMRFLGDGVCAFSYITLDDYAECGAVDADAEALIDTLRSLRGIRVACLLKERPDKVRGSLRAKDDDTDVASLANELGGGGHRAAAGFTLRLPLEESIVRVQGLLEELCASE